MGYDSRRWTGRYAPREIPPEFGNAPLMAAAAYGWQIPHHWEDWAVWALAFVATASNLPALFAEFATPWPQEDAA